MKGLFQPRNPEKYIGDPRKIRFLSSWERRFMEMCDSNPNVLKWGSEELKIPYYNPIKKKTTVYYPDFIVTYKTQKGDVKTEVIEIKPLKETKLTKKASTYDLVQLAINRAKWGAAVAFCKRHGIEFKVLTEMEMFR